MDPLPIDDKQQFAESLGLTVRQVVLYAQRTHHYYKRFTVSKKSGYGSRRICAPSRELKGIQRWILAFILRHVDVHDQCIGFRPGKSIVDNALPHVNKDFVLRTDVKDFFPSIHVRRVVGLFKALGYSPNVAHLLARLTTYRGALPQGAPTSPAIANLICRGLDARLHGYAQSNNWDYTRYCDDLTISGAGRIAKGQLQFVEKIVNEEGFLLNHSKTSILRANRRQLVTGIVVNERVNIPRRLRKRWRAMFHQADLYPEEFVERLDELQGIVAYLQMVRPEDTAIENYRAAIAQLQAYRASDS